MREGSKSWIGRTSTPQSGKPGKYGNSKGSYKTAYAAFPDWDEATALNALVDLGEADDDKNVGDAIQLQLAAFTAFSRAKGKGKGKPKGKGKVIRSNLIIEQRRKHLAEIKAKLKCLRCEGYRHWAGDPACKFPGAKGSSSGPKGNPR